ncbi:LacI family DNA-binding transcriptional regulator [Pseudoalteromonas tunicata]|jgi:LacI family transcriptional regulator|uniref:Transcriptional regulator, LacI family protein n=1 Tax=Pseudoalteromonas tunicata D2 TaxID=87626 RepID=A4CBC8_9GAMM|nr:LacI family DNA-binding transcriptional regulator [Pseudoalteromonas tunicata]ATC94220.1 LacI family transcriptional regulator [Pseudoalteromonas tunicata]AXT29978.1 LacI family DNA-binding transcriptional regulator [Pseudoalteromonas tunicata]EAR27665.1 transcriptional regulator, LacI family protein [Pseudoalteromonas tunicata D2]
MKVTINDVAKLAGVSMKTVSRVMNNEPSVRKKTYDEVMKAVNELKYQPNLAARSLAGTKSFTVGLVYDNPNAYYVLDMQKGILSRCKDEGYELLIHPCSGKDENMLEELTTMVTRARISGLILTPPLSEREDVIEALDKLEVNYVRVLSGRQTEETQTDCIFVNDRDASFAITEHLIGLGHRNIAFLSGDKEHKSTLERLAGYKEALSSNNINIDDALIIDGHYSFESGVNNAKALLSENKSVTAIFACNDEIAAGALFAARLMTIKIPQQLSIAGFEDNPFSRQTWPKLTTAHQSIETIAQHAAQLLFTKTRGTRNKPKELRKMFTPELVIRDSTGALE